MTAKDMIAQAAKLQSEALILQGKAAEMIKEAEALQQEAKKLTTFISKAGEVEAKIDRDGDLKLRYTTPGTQTIYICKADLANFTDFLRDNL